MLYISTSGRRLQEGGTRKACFVSEGSRGGRAVVAPLRPGLYILLGQESKSDEPVLDNAHRCYEIQFTIQLAFHSDII
jgi:hypothetical protein